MDLLMEDLMDRCMKEVVLNSLTANKTGSRSSLTETTLQPNRSMDTAAMCSLTATMAGCSSRLPDKTGEMINPAQLNRGQKKTQVRSLTVNKAECRGRLTECMVVEGWASKIVLSLMNRAVVRAELTKNVKNSRLAKMWSQQQQTDRAGKSGCEVLGTRSEMRIDEVEDQVRGTKRKKDIQCSTQQRRRRRKEKVGREKGAFFSSENSTKNKFPKHIQTRKIEKSANTNSLEDSSDTSTAKPCLNLGVGGQQRKLVKAKRQLSIKLYIQQQANSLGTRTV